ncbi:aspartyl protease family protein [Pontixanthobacter sp.]|uniref:aspartyl protease family protein n=1 Tax=Pontixanthobacter sp. TaxID=2792078 RepID=UPI003C7D83D5
MLHFVLLAGSALAAPIAPAHSLPDREDAAPKNTAPENTAPENTAPENTGQSGATNGEEVVEGQADFHKRLTVPVTIKGEGPFRFMIDTGAQATVVTRGLTERLKLPSAGRATVVGMASSKAVDLVELSGLEFAARIFGTIEAPMLEARNIGADGILGLDSLQDLRVLIDFRANSIAVDNAAALGGNAGYEIVVRARRRLGRLIITNAVIDGVKTAVIIDTGAQNSFGNPALKRKLRSRSREEVSATDVNGAVLVGDRHIAKSVRIQRMQLVNMPITFADSPAFAALKLDRRPALIMGMRDLRLLDRLAIDFERRQVLFDMPANTRNVRDTDIGFRSSRR